MHEGQVSSIYVVDDEELIAHSLGLILEREGFDVSCFTNPLEALGSINDSAPDLLISDVIMPELSGIDLAIQTRKRSPDCRILLFSASSADAMHQAAQAGYNFRLLQKPLHPTMLLEEIERIAAAPVC